MKNGNQENNEYSESNENLYSEKGRRNSRDFRLRTVKFNNFNNIYKKVNNQPPSSVTKLVNLSPWKMFNNNNLPKSNNLKIKLRRQDTLKTVTNNLFLSASSNKQNIIEKEPEKENPVIVKINEQENVKTDDTNLLNKPTKKLKSSSELINLQNKKYRYSGAKSNLFNYTDNTFKGRVSRRKLATVRPVFTYQFTDKNNLYTKSLTSSNNYLYSSKKLNLDNSNISQYKDIRNSVNASEENNNNKNASKKSFSLFYNISSGERNKRQVSVSKKNQSPKIYINPFAVPEEDKIFDEMKSYLCFKCDTDENNNNNTEKNNLLNNNSENKNVVNTDSNNNAKLKSRNKKRKKILSADDKKLESLYSFSYSVDNKLRTTRLKKNNKELEEYQDCLLENIKPILPFNVYMDLKRKFEVIREKVQKKYKNNLENIKEIEYDEENIINQINYICKQCLKNFNEMRTNKSILHASNLKIKLPMIKFVTCFRSHKKLKNKNKNDKMKPRLSISKNKARRNSNHFNKSVKSGKSGKSIKTLKSVKSIKTIKSGSSKNKEVFDTEIYSLTNYNKRKSKDCIRLPINKNKDDKNKRYSISTTKSVEL